MVGDPRQSETGLGTRGETAGGVADAQLGEKRTAGMVMDRGRGSGVQLPAFLPPLLSTHGCFYQNPHSRMSGWTDRASTSDVSRFGCCGICIDRIAHW